MTTITDWLDQQLDALPDDGAKVAFLRDYIDATDADIERLEKWATDLAADGPPPAVYCAVLIEKLEAAQDRMLRLKAQIRAKIAEYERQIAPMIEVERRPYD
jgi:hypothetical protein